MPSCAGTHPLPEGPNEDVGQCGTCHGPVGVPRPEGETMGLHADDCSLPIRHPGECEPGGDGHPVAPVVRGFWPGMDADVAAARERHGSLPATRRPPGALVHNAADPRCPDRLPDDALTQDVADMTCRTCLAAMPRTHGREMTDAEVAEATAAPGILCPECVQGKCVNCTGDVLTGDDTLEPCQHRVDKVHP